MVGNVLVRLDGLGSLATSTLTNVKVTLAFTVLYVTSLLTDTAAFVQVQRLGTEARIVKLILMNVPATLARLGSANILTIISLATATKVLTALYAILILTNASLILVVIMVGAQIMKLKFVRTSLGNMALAAGNVNVFRAGLA